METIALGTQGLHVSRQGLGCMGMSEFYGPGDDAESVATIHRALELGVTFFDTADMYGPYVNEELVGAALAGHRDRVVIATKFGIVRDTSDTSSRSVNGRPEYVRRSCEGSLTRLGVDHIDLYYQHRVDPNTPIEETVGAMAELVAEGKVRYLGLSEAAPATIGGPTPCIPSRPCRPSTRSGRASPRPRSCPPCASWASASCPTARSGAGSSPGPSRDVNELDAHDTRRRQPRFLGENLAGNVAIVEVIDELAEANGCTAAQIALAFVHAAGRDVAPIPGTKRRRYLEQNVAALEVELTEEDLAVLDRVAPTRGDRYADMSPVDG